MIIVERKQKAGREVFPIMLVLFAIILILNLTWTDSVQKYITHTTTQEKPGTYSTNRITKLQADKWKKKMTPEEIQQVRNFA